jgi:beta-lactamase regulating signal transducer with metallopeptidase domain
VLAPAAWVIASCANRGWTEWNLARTLNAISRPSDFGSDVRLLDRPEPVAITVGWRAPTILLSTGLVEELSQPSIDIIIEHERAHIDRRDTWFALIDRMAAGLLPRASGRALTSQILIAREQACDAIAAARTDGKQAVACVLDEVLRIQSAPGAHKANTTEPIAARIDRLLHPPAPRCLAWASPLAFFALGLALGAGPIHAAAERVVGLLLH